MDPLDQVALLQIFFNFECTSNVFSMTKTFGPATRMSPNIWNALRMQSEFLECTSNIQECRKNFHSDGIRAHSASSVTGVLVEIESFNRPIGHFYSRNTIVYPYGVCFKYSAHNSSSRDLPSLCPNIMINNIQFCHLNWSLINIIPNNM